MKKIAVLTPYFGQFPEWSELFFDTLRRNNTIDFIFFTDCDYHHYECSNIIFNKLSFVEYLRFVNRQLGFEFSPANAYKICDLRPLFGYIHEEILRPYDFYGWADMDILFGDIRNFYTDDVLEHNDALSSHNDRISGHFALFRNSRKNRLFYRKIYKWKEALLEKEFVGIDEHGISNAYMHTFFDKFNEKYSIEIDNCITRMLSQMRKKKLHMIEQYSTPFTAIPWIDGTLYGQQPDVWYYRDGIITNNRDAGRNFLYLHFMNFKSSQWRHDGTKAPWEGKCHICSATVNDMIKGIRIDTSGIHPISK